MLPFWNWTFLLKAVAKQFIVFIQDLTFNISKTLKKDFILIFVYYYIYNVRKMLFLLLNVYFFYSNICCFLTFYLSKNLEKHIIDSNK